MELTKKGLLLAKKETSYGVDPTPTAAANNIAVARGQVTMSHDSEIIDRDILDGSFNIGKGTNALFSVTLNFSTEIRGNRTNGTSADISSGSISNAIEIDPLLLACDLGATYQAETSGGARNGYVEYIPSIPAAGIGTSVTFYFYSQDKLYKITGAKGTFKMSAQAGKYGQIDWTFQGLMVSVVDASIPSSPTWLNCPPPLFTGTQLVNFSSFFPVARNWEFDLGNVLKRRDNMSTANGTHGFVITGRDSKARVVMESEKEATIPVWADWEARSVLGVVLKSNEAQTGNTWMGTLNSYPDKLTYSDDGGVRLQTIEMSCRAAGIGSVAGAEVRLRWL